MFQPGEKVFWAEVSTDCGDPVSVWFWEGTVVMVRGAGYMVKPYSGTARFATADLVSDDYNQVRVAARACLERLKVRYVRAFDEAIRRCSREA